MDFVTHNDSEEIDVNGTFLVGVIEISYDELKSVFGEPQGPSSDNKADAEWTIEFEDDTVATIYNYKDGPAYCGEEGTPVEDITEWHIGGYNRKAFTAICEALGLEQDN